MQNTKKCKGCGRFFGVDRRSQQRHVYCRASQCQRARRAQSQRLRRQSQHTAVSNRTSSEAGSRLQSRLKPTEADWNVENPVVVGLISMLTGSEDLEEIKTVIRRLYEQGTNILGLKPLINYESLTK